MAREMPKFSCLVVAIALALLSLSVHAHEPAGDSQLPGTCVACSLQHSPGTAAASAPAAVGSLPASDVPTTPWVGIRLSRAARSGPFDRGPPAA